MNNYAIYPKEFKDLKQKINEKMCFIIMPFKEEKKEVYETIKRAIQACGLNYDRSDELKKSSPFINKIINSITTAYYLIVDISDLNANVLYELGIAHTLRDADRVLILKDNETECPSDLKHINYFSYEKSRTLQLYDHVVNFLKSNHYINDLKELMLLLNIIEDNSDSTLALNILQNELTSHCITIIHILNNLIKKVSENEANESLIGLYDLYSKFFKNNPKLGEIYLKLICFSLQKLTKDYNLSHFVTITFANIDIDFDDFETLNSKTELAVLLLEFESTYKEVYNWIKLFLYKSSPASVDVARYKLHVGIINSKSQNVKDFLLNILELEKSTTLIEHSLNLCKAKNIKESVPLALEILSNTENPFVFRSAIDLITDVGSVNQQDKMFGIIIEKQDIVDNNDFIKVHIKRAEMKRDN